jgi:hypothetical protein
VVGDRQEGVDNELNGSSAYGGSGAVWSSRRRGLCSFGRNGGENEEVSAQWRPQSGQVALAACA